MLPANGATVLVLPTGRAGRPQRLRRGGFWTDGVQVRRRSALPVGRRGCRVDTLRFPDPNLRDARGQARRAVDPVARGGRRRPGRLCDHGTRCLRSGALHGRAARREFCNGLDRKLPRRCGARWHRGPFDRELGAHRRTALASGDRRHRVHRHGGGAQRPDCDLWCDPRPSRCASGLAPGHRAARHRAHSPDGGGNADRRTRGVRSDVGGRSRRPPRSCVAHCDRIFGASRSRPLALQDGHRVPAARASTGKVWGRCATASSRPVRL